MSGSPTPDPPDGPGGLIVIIRDDPATSARSLADDLDAELAVGGAATESALLRLDRPNGDDEDRGSVAHLDRLAAAMRRAEATSERTRAEAAEQLARTINTDLAIHPDTLHRAAAELLQAAARVHRAGAGRPEGPALTVRRIRAGGSGGLAAAGIAIGALGAPVVGAAVVAVGLAGGAIARHVSRRAIRATLPTLVAQEAIARRRWEQLAGPDAEPNDVDAVVHRYDPQHRIVADLVAHHPAVRAAERAATVHRTAWVQAWRREVGDDHEAVAPPDAVASLHEWAPSSAASPLPTVGSTTGRDTLVVAAPYAELSDERARGLHLRLLALPPGRRVIVVLGPDLPARPGPAVCPTDPAESLIDLTEAVDQAPSAGVADAAVSVPHPAP